MAAASPWARRSATSLPRWSAVSRSWMTRLRETSVVNASTPSMSGLGRWCGEVVRRRRRYPHRCRALERRGISEEPEVQPLLQPLGLQLGLPDLLALERHVLLPVERHEVIGGR